MRDFYIREPGDPNYVSDVLEVSDEMEALVYQIISPIKTANGDVFGELGFGANMEANLFSISDNISAQAAKMTNQVNKYSELAKIYKVDISIKKVPDTQFRDAGILDIAIGGRTAFGMTY
jgi:hypothetical protein